MRPFPASRDSRPLASNVTATVKWFNPTKGFGFVQPDDGSPDAFLHASVVEQAGHQTLFEGTTIVCDLTHGQKGPQVAAIHRVEAGPPGAARGPSAGPRRSGGTAVEGKVKFFNAEKGFGFITPDDGGKDIFVSSRTLQQDRLGTLAENQRVRVTTRMGEKGPMADSVELI